MPSTIEFLKHWLSSKTRYAVHSPFVYEFVTKVLPHKKSPEGERIEKLRKELASSNEKIEIRDFGAGYGNKSIPTIEKTLKEIVAGSARKRREGELLFRICKHYQPKVCLELGTNLGISALYQLLALSHSVKYVTIEGSPNLAKKAKENIIRMGRNVEVISGDFKTVLSTFVKPENLKPDFVFLDGHHQYEATMEYFNKIVPFMPPNSIFILDDIRWSDEMRKAWKEICDSPKVTVSLDLFSMGICFIDRPQAKEHFALRFKPI